MDISVISPVYNEAKNLQRLYREISEVLDERYDHKEWEIIFVDDGSTDKSYRVLKKLQEKDSNVKLIRFRRNFGQSAALNAGFDHAEGSIIVTTDSDLQNDPKDIPRLIEKLKEGYDCVSGWRKERKDPLMKRFPSWIQTKVSMKMGPRIHDFGCTLKAYRAEAIDHVNLYGEGHRYIPTQLHKRGFEITEIEVNHRERKHGRTKYGIFRLMKGSLDLIFNYFWNRYSVRPLHFLGSLGSIFMLIGFIIGMYRVIMKYVYGVSVLPKIAQLLLAVGLVLFGFLLVMFGFLAEMLTKIFYEERKPYVVQETRGLEETE